ncbi:MAG TPA: hypothetical protein VFK21_11470, partial [Gammaproteobacteria bacterium]|nr:hypothetical protein [Gammaproteobacteria bacterium]
MDTKAQIDDPLKSLEEVTKPDVRSTLISGGLSQIHVQLSVITLHKGVPIAIRQHFETAKNVSLYAWFAYRFHQIAEMQGFASLELALREKIKRDEPWLAKRHPRAGLSKLLE